MCQSCEGADVFREEEKAQATHLDQAVGERDTTTANPVAGLLAGPLVLGDHVDGFCEAALTVLVRAVLEPFAIGGGVGDTEDVPAFGCLGISTSKRCGNTATKLTHWYPAWISFASKSRQWPDLSCFLKSSPFSA